MINFGSLKQKNKGKCSDFSLKLELLFIWAIFVYEMKAEICVLGESHTVDKCKGILPQFAMNYMLSEGFNNITKFIKNSNIHFPIFSCQQNEQAIELP